MTKPKKLYVIDEEAGVLDEVQGWFLALADNEGWVYTAALRQLVNRMYRDRDYQEKRTRRSGRGKGATRPTTMPSTATRRRSPG
jgi:hypothetical protein